MHIFEESMSMVVVFHVYIQEYTKFWEKIVWEEVYATISDRLCLSVCWQYFISVIGISDKSHIGATLLVIHVMHLYMWYVDPTINCSATIVGTVHDLGCEV